MFYHKKRKRKKVDYGLEEIRSRLCANCTNDLFFTLLINFYIMNISVFTLGRGEAVITCLYQQMRAIFKYFISDQTCIRCVDNIFPTEGDVLCLV